jgi:hypothetical protein
MNPGTAMYESHNYLVNSTAALFTYSGGSLLLKNPRVIRQPEELPEITRGAERELKRELERNPKVKFNWAK